MRTYAGQLSRSPWCGLCPLPLVCGIGGRCAAGERQSRQQQLPAACQQGTSSMSGVLRGGGLWWCPGQLTVCCCMSPCRPLQQWPGAGPGAVWWTTAAAGTVLRQGLQLRSGGRARQKTPCRQCLRATDDDVVSKELHHGARNDHSRSSRVVCSKGQQDTVGVCQCQRVGTECWCGCPACTSGHGTSSRPRVTRGVGHRPGWSGAHLGR